VYAEDPTVITGALCGGVKNNDVLEPSTMPDADGMRLTGVPEMVIRPPGVSVWPYIMYCSAEAAESFCDPIVGTGKSGP